MPLQEEHMGSYAIRRSAEEPGEGRLQDVGRSPAFMAKAGLGCRQRRGLSCPFPARESEAVSKEPTPHNFCLEGVGVEDFHARIGSTATRISCAFCSQFPGICCFSRDEAFRAALGWF